MEEGGGGGVSGGGGGEGEEEEEEEKTSGGWFVFLKSIEFLDQNRKETIKNDFSFALQSTSQFLLIVYICFTCLIR